MKKVAPALLGVLLLAGLLACAGAPAGRDEGPSAPAAEKALEAPPPPEPETADIGNGDIRGSRGEGEGEDWLGSELAPPASAALKPLASRPETPQASGLKAGFADDNRQFNYFVEFLRQYGPQVDHIPIPVEERIVLRAQDAQGRPLASAQVTIFGNAGGPLARGLTYADGSFLFFPAEHGGQQRYRAVLKAHQTTREVRFERDGRREILVPFDFPRPVLESVPLDILFVLDATGSMSEEIQRLKSTIEIINLNLSSLPSRPRVRYGLVLYRDRGDEYVTRTVPFTADLGLFQAALDRAEADGGGDTPEDLQAALRDALRLSWNRDGIRLAFIITDAPPHLDYGEEYTYVDAAHDARGAGIKLFSVGTGGLELDGELILRQLSQYTAARYIFLTYGEQGESEGGKPGSVSHHTGANWQTDKLEAIIIRIAREELSFASDQPLEPDEEYFQAAAVREEDSAETLDKLFSQALSQLIDYSSYRIPPDTPASVLPLGAAAPELGASAEYFTEQLTLSFSRGEVVRRTFRVLERRDLQAVLEELELQLSALADEGAAARVGKLLGAEVLVTGRLFAKGGGFELFLKLLRVDTGEVLSVTKAVIDRRLGIEG